MGDTPFPLENCLEYLGTFKCNLMQHFSKIVNAFIAKVGILSKMLIYFTDVINKGLFLSNVGQTEAYFMPLHVCTFD